MEKLTEVAIMTASPLTHFHFIRKLFSLGHRAEWQDYTYGSIQLHSCIFIYCSVISHTNISRIIFNLLISWFKDKANIISLHPGKHY